MAGISILLSLFFILKSSASFIDIIILGMAVYLLVDTYGKKIIIGEDGVTFAFTVKKYTIKWKDMRYIGIHKLDLGKIRKPISVICFSTKPVDTLDISPKNIGSSFIMSYNVKQEVIDEVKKYWNKNINGL